jgi:Uma2 family endonuclease
MVSSTEVVLPRARDGDGWTIADLPVTVWPRIELVDGGLLVTPYAGRRHQRVVTELAVSLSASDLPPGYEVLAGVNVVHEGDLLIPDVAVVLIDAAHEEWVVPAETLLVVEVESRSTRLRDVGYKADLYAAWGIEDYWRVTASGEVVRLHLVDGRYEPGSSAVWEAVELPPLPR